MFISPLLSSSKKYYSHFRSTMSGMGHSSPPPRAAPILSDEESLSTRYILFQELYVHMTGLYQVMKSSSDVSFPRHASSPPSSMQPQEDMVSTSSFPDGNSGRNLSNNSLGDNVDQRHYILLLPPSDCFSEVATRVSSESGQLPTFAASVGSHTGHSGGGGFGGASRGASPSPSSPFFGSNGNSKANVNWRLKHNIVRSHVFQGSQWHKIISKKLRNGGSSSSSSGSFTIPLTGLTGTQAELQTTPSNASTLLSKLRFNPGERSISSIAGGDKNIGDREPLATISFNGAGSLLLPPGATTASSSQTTIQVLDVLQYGNLTIFFVDEAVGITTPKVSNGSLGRAPPSAQRAQSQLSCSQQSPPLSPRAGIIGGSGSGLGSQVWWQRVPASASRALPTPPKTRRISLEAPSKNGKPTLFSPFITDKIDQSVLQMFRKDERTLVTTFQEIAESRGVSTDEVMTAMDTETAIFNSSYVCMPGYEKFTVSKVEQMVDSAMDTFIDAVDRCVAATVSTRPARKRVSGSLETPPGKNIPPPATPPPKLALTGALKSALKSATKGGSKNKLDESDDEGSPRYRQATLDPNATHQSDSDNDSVSSCNITRETLFSEDDEEQVYMVLHTVITSALAKKLNAHWGTITPAEDYAFHHACLSLRRSLETTIMDFVPPACADTISISSFEKCFRLCKVVDSPDAGVFTCLRAMEATIASIVDVVNEHSTRKQDVTADVCIPLVVVVLIGACLMHFPSRLKLLLELMLPVVELSSLGYALTTFEASSEQIYYEYSLFVQNKADE